MFRWPATLVHVLYIIVLWCCIAVQSSYVEILYKDPQTHQRTSDWNYARFGTTGHVRQITGKVVHVLSEDTMNHGCSQHVNKVPAGNWIALIQRGRCKFSVKIRLASSTHNASAVVIYNNRGEDIVLMSHSVQNSVAVFIGQSFGEKIAALVDSNVTVNMVVGTAFEPPTTTTTTTTTIATTTTPLPTKLTPSIKPNKESTKTEPPKLVTHKHKGHLPYTPSTTTDGLTKRILSTTLPATPTKSYTSSSTSSSTTTTTTVTPTPTKTTKTPSPVVDRPSHAPPRNGTGIHVGASTGQEKKEECVGLCLRHLILALIFGLVLLLVCIAFLGRFLYKARYEKTYHLWNKAVITFKRLKEDTVGFSMSGVSEA